MPFYKSFRLFPTLDLVDILKMTAVIYTIDDISMLLMEMAGTEWVAFKLSNLMAI